MAKVVKSGCIILPSVSPKNDGIANILRFLAKQKVRFLTNEGKQGAILAVLYDHVFVVLSRGL